jgi:hypothetical protein
LNSAKIFYKRCLAFEFFEVTPIKSWWATLMYCHWLITSFSEKSRKPCHGSCKMWEHFMSRITRFTHLLVVGGGARSRKQGFFGRFHPPELHSAGFTLLLVKLTRAKVPAGPAGPRGPWSPEGPEGSWELLEPLRPSWASLWSIWDYLRVYSWFESYGSIDSLYSLLSPSGGRSCFLSWKIEIPWFIISYIKQYVYKFYRFFFIISILCLIKVCVYKKNS